MILIWLGCSTPLEPDRPFELPVANPRLVRFLAFGDAGKGNSMQKDVAKAMVSVCATKGCDFALVLGDNLYPAGMARADDPRMDQAFTDVYADLDLPFALVLGNHDWGKRHRAEPASHQIQWAKQHPTFHLPQKNYRFQAGDLEFWAVDTDTVFWQGVDPQGAWLDQTMAASEARWKVVFGHHPYRSDGRHGNAGSYGGWSWIPYASSNALRTFFEGHVVGSAHLYLSGHEHNLQAFEHQGLQLVVSGAGATSTPIEDRGNQPDLAFGQTGFAWISLGEQMEVEFYDHLGAKLGRRIVERPEIPVGRSR